MNAQINTQRCGVSGHHVFMELFNVTDSWLTCVHRNGR